MDDNVPFTNHGVVVVDQCLVHLLDRFEGAVAVSDYVFVTIVLVGSEIIHGILVYLSGITPACRRYADHIAG